MNLVSHTHFALVSYPLQVSGITLQKPKLKELHPNIQSTAKETLLTPRFYTTDFEALAKMDISINEEELKAILEDRPFDIK